MSEPGAPERSGLLEEAATWFARMRGPEAEASRAEFERWLARGALHRAAYNRAAEVFAMGKLLADDQSEPSTSKSPPPRADRRSLLVGSAAILAIAFGGSLLLTRSRLQRPASQSIADTVEPRATTAQLAELAAGNVPQSIRLADNSLVRLASGTRIAVQYGRNERRLSLEGGRARFYVAHERRPFIVYAGGGYVVAHGTVFDVGIANGSRVTVQLIEGIVDVSTPRKAADQVHAHVIHRLRAGEAVSFAASATPGLPSPALASSVPSRNMEVATTITERDAGAPDFDSMPLGDVVRIANQRSARPIRFGDPKIAELRISGEFRIDNTEVLAERIAGLFDIGIDRRSPTEIVLKLK